LLMRLPWTCFDAALRRRLVSWKLRKSSYRGCCRPLFTNVPVYLGAWKSPQKRCWVLHVVLRYRQDIFAATIQVSLRSPTRLVLLTHASCGSEERRLPSGCVSELEESLLQGAGGTILAADLSLRPTGERVWRRSLRSSRQSRRSASALASRGTPWWWNRSPPGRHIKLSDLGNRGGPDSRSWRPTQSPD
jgi:hypothetical protein